MGFAVFDDWSWDVCWILVGYLIVGGLLLDLRWIFIGRSFDFHGFPMIGGFSVDLRWIFVGFS